MPSQGNQCNASLQCRVAKSELVFLNINGAYVTQISGQGFKKNGIYEYWDENWGDALD